MILNDVILVILILQPKVSCNNCVAAFCRGSGDFVLDNVVCTGDESLITVCRLNGFEQDNFEHDEDVVVICCECKISLN